MKPERHHFRIEPIKRTSIHRANSYEYTGEWKVMFRGSKILATFAEFEDAELFVNTYFAAKLREWQATQPKQVYKPLPASALVCVSTVIQ